MIITVWENSENTATITVLYLLQAGGVAVSITYEDSMPREDGSGFRTLSMFEGTFSVLE